MKRRNILGIELVVATLLLMLGSNIVLGSEWNPKRTWAFFVCLVEWKNSRTFASFPQKNRKDKVLLEVLRKRGVPDSQIVYLADADADTVTVETRFAEFLKKPAAGDWVYVYFEGHGYKTDDAVPYLATYDAGNAVKGWRFDSIPDTIEKHFKGSHAIIALDNCYSGEMANSVKRAPRRVSYGVLASSRASQISTSNWTFTESLISAFNGEAFVDRDRNGLVTFAELGKNSEEDMLFGEEQMATIAFTGSFDPQMIIAKAGRVAAPRVGERVEAYSANDWWKGFIIDSRPGEHKIHYYGWESSDDEWIAEKNLRSPRIIQYSKGAAVEVEWKGKWYPATIVEVEGNVHYIT